METGGELIEIWLFSDARREGHGDGGPYIRPIMDKYLMVIAASSGSHNTQMHTSLWLNR